MKSALIIFLAILTIVLGFGIFSLRKELLNIRESAAFYEKRSDGLQTELARLSRACDAKERFLNEIEQGISELESKIQLKTLQRYVPVKTWDEIGPIIEKLKALQETRESNYLSGGDGTGKDD